MHRHFFAWVLVLALEYIHSLKSSMGVQGLFPLTHWRSCALSSIQGVFKTHSLAFTCTHKHSGGVQYSLTGIHVHSIAFRGCSILTQMQSFSWSHHGELHSIMTQWRSCTLNGCSHSLNGIHAHSMGVQGLFPLTHWHSCTLNGCSGAVHNHSKAFTYTHKRSGCVQYSLKGFQPVHILKGPNRFVSNMRSTLRPYKFALNFRLMPFLRLRQTRRHDVALE
jgi:hypothetical protein